MAMNLMLCNFRPKRKVRVQSNSIIRSATTYMPPRLLHASEALKQAAIVCTHWLRDCCMGVGQQAGLPD